MAFVQYLNYKYVESASKTGKGVFHGSPEKFAKFEGGNQGRNYGHGHYFTENKSEAEEYALRSDQDGYLYTVDLNAKNPYNPRSPEDAKKLASVLKLKWSDVKKDSSWKDAGTGMDETDKDNYYAKLANTYIAKLVANNESWTSVDRDLGKALKQAGFDSVYDPTKKWWVVPEPEKIKISKVTKVKFKGYS